MWRWPPASSTTSSRKSAIWSDDILGGHDLLALLEDHLALVVQHIVIFQDVLADLEVARFDLLLRLFQGLVDPGMGDGFAVLQPQPGEDRVHALRAEDAHQIVLQGQEEFGGAGIALAARTAAQLVVDAPAFVALGADRRRGRRRPAPSPCCRRLRRGWRSLLAARSASSVMAASSCLDAHFGIAAQLDVGAAARHVGGDGDRAGHAGLGDDEGFLLVIARVQHVMLDLALLQQVGKLLRTSRSRWCPPAPAGRARGIPGSA